MVEDLVCCVHWAVTHFVPYLSFCEFQICLPGKPMLLLVKGGDKLSNHCAHWLLALSSYHFTFMILSWYLPTIPTLEISTPGENLQVALYRPVPAYQRKHWQGRAAVAHFDGNLGTTGWAPYNVGGAFIAAASRADVAALTTNYLAKMAAAVWLIEFRASSMGA